MLTDTDVAVRFSPDGALVASTVDVRGATHVQRTRDGKTIRVVDPLAGGFAIAPADRAPIALTTSGGLACVDGNGNIRTSPAGATKWKSVFKGAGPATGALLHATDDLIVVAFAASSKRAARVVRVSGTNVTEWELPDGDAVLALWVVAGAVGLIVETSEAVTVWRWPEGESAGVPCGVLTLPHPTLRFVAPRNDGSLLAFSRRRNAAPETWLDKPPRWIESHVSIHDPDGSLRASTPITLGRKIDLEVAAASSTEAGSTRMAYYHRPYVGVSSAVWLVDDAAPASVRVFRAVHGWSFQLDPSGRFAAVTPSNDRMRPRLFDLERGEVRFGLGTEARDVGGVVVQPLDVASLEEPEEVVAIPTAPQLSWGGLYVRARKGGTISVGKVRKAVMSAYAKAGVAPVAWASLDELRVHVPTALPDLELEVSTALGPDEVLLVAENDRWCGVFSRAWEWGAVGAHPLAVALSKSFDVLGVQTERDQYVAYVRYERGAATSALWLGSADTPKPEALSDLPELDLPWLAGTFVTSPAPTAEELLRVSMSPERILEAGICGVTGHREAFEAAPLEDYDPKDYLVLRAIA